MADTTTPATIEQNKPKGDGKKDVADPKDNAAAQAKGASDKIQKEANQGPPGMGTESSDKDKDKDKDKTKAPVGSDLPAELAGGEKPDLLSQLSQEPLKDTLARVRSMERGNGDFDLSAVSAFGAVEWANPNDSDTVANAQADVKAKAEVQDGKGKTGDAGDSSVFGRLTDWASSEWTALANSSLGKAANEYVVQPVEGAASSAWNSITDGWDYMVHFADQNADRMSSKVNADFTAENNFQGAIVDGSVDKSDGKKDGKIDLPKDAKEAGPVDAAGNKLKVLRSASTHETFLQDEKTGEVIGTVEPDGSSRVTLKDGSIAHIKISGDQEHGYKLDQSERHDKQGRLVSKVKDGISYDIDYEGKDGKPLKKPIVRAVGDIHQDHDVTPEEMHKKLQQVAQEVGGDIGGGVVKFHNDKTNHVTRGVVRVLPDGTKVEMDLDNHQARIFRNGQEYVRSGDHIMKVGKNGQQEELSDAEKKDLGELTEKIKHRLKQAEQVSRGERQTIDDDNARIEQTPSAADPSKKDVKVVQNDDNGKAIGETTASADPKQGIENRSLISGETTTVQGNDIRVVDNQGNQIFSFDESSGASTDRFNFDENGLTDTQTGTRIDFDGDVFDPSGNMILDAGAFDADNDDGSGAIGGRSEISETQAEVALAQTYGSQAASLASSALSSMSVQNADLCKNIVLDALGLVNSVDPDNDNLQAMLVLQGPKAACYDALAAVDVGNSVTSQAIGAGLNDSNYALDDMIKTASLSVATSPVAVLDEYRQRKLQQEGLSDTTFA